MEEKVKETVEIKQRSLAEENQKAFELIKERYYPQLFSWNFLCICVLAVFLLALIHIMFFLM